MPQDADDADGDGDREEVVRIEALVAGGDGLAHLPDGRALFVPLAAPGDRVRVDRIERRPRFARARLAEVLEPGPARVRPACPVFGVCGGCTWQHVDYPAQLDAKRTLLRDALERIGRLALPDGEIPVTPSPHPYRTRWRTRVLVRGDRVGYRQRRSHELCAVEACPVLVEPLERALSALATDPGKRSGEWELAVSQRGEVRARPTERRGSRRHALEWNVCGDTLRFSAGVFAQGNALLLDDLASAVRAAAAPAARCASGGATLIELHAGAGFLTLGLARDFANVVAVESSTAAGRDLVHNARRAGLSGVEVIAERVERALPGLLGRRVDAVVLDPPRSGLEKGAAARVAELGARRIVYLSCDPATLARDLSEMSRDGAYRLAHVEAFDLFPQTPHVEALVALDAVNAD